MNPFTVPWRLWRTLRARYRMSQYDDFTIAEHFRAQGAHIGERCRLIVRNLGSEPFLVSIGNHVTVAGGVSFVTHDGGTWIFTDEHPSLQKFGRVEVLDNCFIGLGAILMPNVRIGPNAIVAAGSVVTKDVPPGMVVGGNPARSICSIDDYRARIEALWETQKPPGYFADLQNGVAYAPAEIQRCKTRDFGLLRAHLTRILPREAG